VSSSQSKQVIGGMAMGGGGGAMNNSGVLPGVNVGLGGGKAVSR